MLDVMRRPDTGTLTRRAFIAVVFAGAVAGHRLFDEDGVATPRAHGGLADPGRRIDRLTVHHTATPHRAGGRDVDAALIARSHRRRGLGIGAGDERDCAYHFVVLPDGRITPGRPLSRPGSGTRDADDNLLSVAVALVGDFSEQGAGTPTITQLRALEGLALWAMCSFGFDAQAVRGHNEVSPSQCPGRRCDVDGIRARLTQARESGRTGKRPPLGREAGA